MNSKRKKDCVAPQNSVIEGSQIPKYVANLFKEQNSAPPTVTATPCNSYHNVKKKKENEFSFDDDGYLFHATPKVLKAGVAHGLQERLYDLPQTLDAVRKVCFVCMLY